MNAPAHPITNEIFNAEDGLFLVAKSINGGIWERNFESGKEYWSPEYYKLLGYEVNEIPASFHTFINLLIHPNDKEKILNVISNHHSQNEFKKQEVRLRTKHGSYKWFENAAIAVHDNAGNLLRIAGIILSIDNKKNMQLRLEKNEALLNETESIAKIAGLSYNVLTKEHIWSKELYNIYEMPVDYKLSTETDKQFYNLETVAFIWETINKSITEKIAIDIEAKVTTGKGNKKWLRAVGKPVVNNNYEVIFVNAVLQDITELKEKELALKQYRERLENSERILQETNHPAKTVALEYDVPSKKLYWCKELHHLYEVADDYIPNLRKDLIFYKEEYRASLLKHINDAELFAKPYNTEAELITAKGNYKRVRIIGESIKNEFDEIIKRKISIQDITDAKKRQLELHESSKIIAHRNARLSNFAHIVSHNLRTHTGNINSLAELIKNETSEDVKQELLILLQNVSQSLNETLNDLTEIVQIQTEIKNVKTIVYFEHVVDSVIKVLSADIFKTETLIDADFSACPCIEYVPAYLESIMLNLISNSIKYKHSERHALIKIKSSVENERSVLKISDNGLGIDLQRYAAKIFNLYQTFHKHSEARGIGLYITKNQVESMGGNIEVESVAGEGTIFKIVF